MAAAQLVLARSPDEVKEEAATPPTRDSVGPSVVYTSVGHKSTYKEREQSLDPDTATAALRKFARWLHQDGKPKPSVKQQLKAILRGLD